MSNIQNFRSALNGFNRQDVVSYIEYMTNQHNSQLQQLNTQLQEALSRSTDTGLQEQLEAAQKRIAELEAALAQSGTEAVNCTEQELEAYRRAERAERLANERSKHICDKANGVLADVSAQMDAAACAIDAAAASLNTQLDAYKQAVADAKDTLHNAVGAMNAITPEEE